MKIVIIEDEKLTAEDLAATITAIDPDARIEVILHSVRNAISYFQKNETPDLIFSDVQLGDGLSFDIFQQLSIKAPVIFCTAYDEYALNAFKTNSVAYILKPFTTASIAEALEKYRGFRQTFTTYDFSYKGLLDILRHRDLPKSSAVLVHYKDKILPVRMEEIALFYIENEITYLITFDKKNYTVSKTLEELEQITTQVFFRVNRQCLLNRRAVIDASQYFSRKLSVNINVPFQEKITVSKEKTPLFLSWLENVQ